jgi:hypothetical protein
MDGSLLGQAFLVIFVGVGTRWLVAYAVTGFESVGDEKKFSRPERVLMASAWIPKATVQAALSYTVIA